MGKIVNLIKPREKPYVFPELFSQDWVNQQPWLIRKIAYCWIACFTGLAYVLFGLGGLVLTNIIFFFLRILPSATQTARERRAQRIIYYAFRSFFWYLRVMRLINGKIEREDYFPQSGSYVVIANHPTLLDIVLILSYFPEATCVVKEALLNNFFLKGVVKEAGYIPNTEGNELIDACVAKLKQGTPLIIFPEGTRSEPGSLNPFQRGAAHIILKSQCIMVPIVIHCTAPILMKYWKWYQVPPYSMDLCLKVYEPIDPLNMIEEGQSKPIAVRKLTRMMKSFFEKEVVHVNY